MLEKFGEENYIKMNKNKTSNTQKRNKRKLDTTTNHTNPSGLRPDRRGRERFDDREHSVHRTVWKIWTSKFRS